MSGAVDLANLTPEQLAGVRAILAAAELTRAKPARKRKPRAAEKIKYLNADELEAFFRTVAKPPFDVTAWQTARDVALFRVAFHRGLRASELGRLQLSDLRMSAERIRFERRKGSNGGEYHLCSSEVRALRAWLKQRGMEPGPLFPSRRGRGISQQMIDVLVKRYGAAAGIAREKCHVHTLKHSCGTMLLERGESIEDVQDHLGHKNIQNTLVYARFTSPRRHARDKRLRDW